LPHIVVVPNETSGVYFVLTISDSTANRVLGRVTVLHFNLDLTKFNPANLEELGWGNTDRH
jgi:hypothetical protein